jgi:hypothetical protein
MDADEKYCITALSTKRGVPSRHSFENVRLNGLVRICLRAHVPSPFGSTGASSLLYHCYCTATVTAQ